MENNFGHKKTPVGGKPTSVSRVENFGTGFLPSYYTTK
nr:MAG TPA: hypothetical protein [Caudoviricetes sp.]